MKALGRWLLEVLTHLWFENLTDKEEVTSDYESVSTIGYTRTDEKDRFDNLENEKENEEVITIDDDPLRTIWRTQMKTRRNKQMEKISL